MADSPPAASTPAEKPVMPVETPATPEKPAAKPRAGFSDLTAVRVSNIVHTLLALGAGWLAPQFHSASIGGAIGLVLLVAVGYPLTILLGRKGVKWWLQNGLIVYLFFFLASWAWMVNA